MAPPMAAEALGRPGFTVNQLAAELAWPAQGIEVGLVESAGGVCSPQADDGDAVALCRALAPDLVLLVADAGLGTINAVRLSVSALSPVTPDPSPLIVVLNRFDARCDLHERNRQWLRDRDTLRIVTMPGEEPTLVTLLRGQ